MSDDELFARLAALNARVGWASSSSYSQALVPQIMMMIEQINMAITDRVERINFDQKLSSTPAVIEIDGPREKRVVADSNSRAKSKSDIITRLRRTSAPVREE